MFLVKFSEGSVSIVLEYVVAPGTQKETHSY